MNYDDLNHPSFIIKCLVIDKMILANMSSDVGLLVVYTGKGKGKTTAALGIVLRSVGHGYKVGMIQFIKGEWYYGELSSSKRLEPEFEMIADLAEDSLELLMMIILLKIIPKSSSRGSCTSK